MWAIIPGLQILPTVFNSRAGGRQRDLLVDTQALKIRRLDPQLHAITGIETVSTHPRQSEPAVSS